MDDDKNAPYQSKDNKEPEQNVGLGMPTVVGAGLPSSAPEGLKVKKSRTLIRFTKLLFALVLAIGLFWGGYQLAVYQSNDGGVFTLPHLNLGKNSNCGGVGYNSICCAQSHYNDNCILAAKPVIYLYPTVAEKVNVRLDYPAGFLRTVPAINPIDGWTVVAHPDGQLNDVSNGRTYPYLYWEGNPYPLRFDMNKGFVVSGSDTRIFLQKQLSEMGLNGIEADAFMQYWLPKMIHNPYNLIHFAGTGYTNFAKLSIEPRPDSLLRVFMAFKALKKPVMVTPQSFRPFHRSGFTAVEWGGAEIFK